MSVGGPCMTCPCSCLSNSLPPLPHSPSMPAAKKARASKLSMSRSMAEMTSGNYPGVTQTPVLKRLSSEEPNLSPTSVLPEYLSTAGDMEDALNFLFPM